MNPTEEKTHGKNRRSFLTGTLKTLPLIALLSVVPGKVFRKRRPKDVSATVTMNPHAVKRSRKG